MPDYVLLTLASSLVYATATALQKHGIATRLPKFALEDVFSHFGELLAAMFKNRVWLLGFAVIPLGLGLEIQAVSMGDISVVRPLSRVESAFSVLIGVTLLGETPPGQPGRMLARGLQPCPRAGEKGFEANGGVERADYCVVRPEGTSPRRAAKPGNVEV